MKRLHNNTYISTDSFLVWTTDPPSAFFLGPKPALKFAESLGKKEVRPYICVQTKKYQIKNCNE